MIGAAGVAMGETQARANPSPGVLARPAGGCDPQAGGGVAKVHKAQGWLTAASCTGGLFSQFPVFFGMIGLAGGRGAMRCTLRPAGASRCQRPGRVFRHYFPSAQRGGEGPDCYGNSGISGNRQARAAGKLAFRPGRAVPTSLIDSGNKWEQSKRQDFPRACGLPRRLPSRAG